ncbi:MAG: hypothetical protein GEU26_18070 [Nitrososphaeraceae archaeon]|nr:hypothetical protein [Nitrososphaeraceae archaeon]
MTFRYNKKLSNRYKKYGFRNYYNPSNSNIVLPSGFTVKSAFRGLKKAWLGFKIAKSKDDDEKMIYYARIIQKLQEELCLPVSNFTNLDMPIR